MRKANVTYELVSGGTTLLERATGDKFPTMVTVYDLDGDRVLLTHYCMEGNQPRMQARSFDPRSSELKFEFLDATNLAAAGAGHMRSVAIRFIDANQFTAAWQFHETGKTKFTEAERYTRIR